MERTLTLKREMIGSEWFVRIQTHIEYADTEARELVKGMRFQWTPTAKAWIGRVRRVNLATQGTPVVRKLMDNGFTVRNADGPFGTDTADFLAKMGIAVPEN